MNILKYIMFCSFLSIGVTFVGVSQTFLNKHLSFLTFKILMNLFDCKFSCFLKWILPTLKPIHMCIGAAPYAFVSGFFTLIVSDSSEWICIWFEQHFHFIFKKDFKYTSFTFQIWKIIGLSKKDRVPQIQEFDQISCPRFQECFISRSKTRIVS